MTAGCDLHLLRHGEPVLTGCLLGRTDCAPTPEGIAACVRAGTALAVERIIASPLQRAAQAGEAIARTLALPLDLDPRWQELDFGAWDGRTADDVSVAEADALGRFWDDPEAFPPPDGERWSALTMRVGAAIDGIAAAGHPVLVVTHAGAMRAALAVACGFDLRRAWAFDLPYAALLSLRLFESDTGPVAQITGLRAP